MSDEHNYYISQIVPPSTITPQGNNHARNLASPPTVTTPSVQLSESTGSAINNRGSGSASESFYKTSLCKFQAAGYCMRGDSCPYAHTTSELRIRPDLTKTRLCINFKKRLCPLTATECPFAHDLRDLRSTDEFYKTELCAFHCRGFCKAGKGCRYAHGPQDLRLRTNSGSTNMSNNNNINNNIGGSGEAGTSSNMAKTALGTRTAPTETTSSDINNRNSLYKDDTSAEGSAPAYDPFGYWQATSTATTTKSSSALSPMMRIDRHASGSDQQSYFPNYQAILAETATRTPSPLMVLDEKLTFLRILRPTDEGSPLNCRSALQRSCSFAGVSSREFDENTSQLGDDSLAFGATERVVNLLLNSPLRKSR